MKILLVTFSDNSDHQDITFGIYEELCSQEDIWLLCMQTTKAELKVKDRVYFVNCPKRPGICLKTFDIVTLWQIICWVRKQTFDVIFFETLHVWNLPIMLYTRKSVHIYQMIHDLIPHDGDKESKQVDLMNRIVCKLSSEIVLCNKKYAEKVTELYGVSPKHVKCIDMWRRFPQYIKPENTKRVLFFGRMNPYKGVDNLLEIVKQCPDIQFDVAGRVDDLVKHLVKRLQKEKNVVINSGYVSNETMEEMFKNADWVILPYNSATQSGVVIDAYRYGKPVIAFDVGAISEQIEDGKTGYLIEAGNNKAFADKLKTVMQMDEREYVTMSRRAYEFGLNKYAAFGAKDRFLKLFN